MTEVKVYLLALRSYFGGGNFWCGWASATALMFFIQIVGPWFFE